MDVEVYRVGGGSLTLAAFADKHGLVMEVHERSRWGARYGFGKNDPPWHVARFYAHFKSVEIREGTCMLLGAAGNGATPEEAIADYANRIVGQRLIYRAMSDDRQEFDAPNEFCA